MRINKPKQRLSFKDLDFIDASRIVRPARVPAIDQSFNSSRIRFSVVLVAGFLILLSVSCTKIIEQGCKRMGYEYVCSQSPCWYSPGYDSIPVREVIFLSASVPKSFIDESSRSRIINNGKTINGPLHVAMISPILQPSVDSFELTAETGKVIKDTVNAPAGQLRGFRTIEWDGSSIDSFKIKIAIKPLAKGIFTFALGQQSSRGQDCELYKYFLNVGNDQHLYYLSQINNGYIGDYERNFGYCLKVY